jgi:hypothetical protein
MRVIAIAVNDLSNPIEINGWLEANPGAVVKLVDLGGSVFYLYYE